MVKKEKENPKLNIDIEKLKKIDLGFDYHSSRFFVLLFSAVYAIAITVFCIEYKIIPGPEFLILGILFYAAYNKRTWRALKDWLPFVTVFISYEVMYSVCRKHRYGYSSWGTTNIDIQMFGKIPTLILQQNFRFPVLDYAGAVFYGIYFFVPTIFAFILWKKKPQKLLEIYHCIWSINLRCTANVPLYPVAPPWYQLAPSLTQHTQDLK